jgi:uncharacterized coiled-coil protein SlyX
MHTKPRAEPGSSTRYVCTKRRIEGPQGCGKVSRNIAPTDFLVSEAVLYRLDSPELARLINGGTDEQKKAKLAEMLDQHRQQTETIQMLNSMVGAGEMTAKNYRQAMQTAEAKLEAIDQEIATLNGHLAARRLLHAGPRVREVWEASNIEWRRRVLALLVEKVVIQPSNTTGMTKAQRWHGWVFKPQDVEVVWTA